MDKMLSSINSPDELRAYKSARKLSQLNKITNHLKRIVLYTLALLGAAAIIRDLYITTSSDSSKTGGNFISCSCGVSVAEAISNGCKYDFLAAAWLPKQCRDDELSNEFDKLGPGPNGEWTYYADEEGNRVLNASDVGQLSDLPGSLYYTTLEWHAVHCYFYWIKGWRAAKNKITLEQRYDNEDHIRHCAKVLMIRDAGYQEVMTAQGPSLQSGEEMIMDIGQRPTLYR